MTDASRAYLMEPHWYVHANAYLARQLSVVELLIEDILYRNPTLEDQALARVHRLGQKREVTTIRFIVKNSFEEVCNFFN